MTDNPTNLFNENRYWNRSRVNAVLVTIPAATLSGNVSVSVPVTPAMIQGNAPLNGICRQIILDASRTGVTYAGPLTPGTFQVSCQIEDALGGGTEYPLFDAVLNIDYDAHAAVILNVMQGSNSGTVANAGVVLGTSLSSDGAGGGPIASVAPVTEMTPWAGAIYADITITVACVAGDTFNADGDLRILFVLE